MKMAEKKSVCEKWVSVDCDIIVIVSVMWLKKKNKPKKLGYGKPFFKALRNSLLQVNTVYFVPESWKEKSWTPNLKSDTWQLPWAW